MCAWWGHIWLFSWTLLCFDNITKTLFYYLCYGCGSPNLSPPILYTIYLQFPGSFKEENQTSFSNESVSFIV